MIRRMDGNKTNSAGYFRHSSSTFVSSEPTVFLVGIDRSNVVFLQTIVSSSYPQSFPSKTPLDSSPSSYIQYKLADDHRYRSSLVSFLHRQPNGSQLATIRYYRLVFHCNLLPGSLFLRFSNQKPYRTVVQNRHDPASESRFIWCSERSPLQYSF